MRDAALIATFELKRAMRTWRAQATLLLYAIASAGSAYLFTRIIRMMENSFADTLGVAQTEVPGAMLDELITSDSYQRMLEGLTGSAHLVEWLSAIPPMAIFYLWVSCILLPFFAASASSESISLDVGSRAIRYEVLRVSRLELVLGRFTGQLLLNAVAMALGTLVVWSVGMLFMVGHTPWGLAGWLAAFSVRAWIFSIPFLGVGMAASQWTTSGAWARVLAVGAVAGSWVVYGIAGWLSEEFTGAWAVAGDVALQVLPQGWLAALWEPGLGWMTAAVVSVALGLAAVSVGYARFAGRDL